MLREMVTDGWPGMPPIEAAVVETRDRRCPDCQKLMARGALFGIVIDHCDSAQHGVWLDCNELAPILTRMYERAPESFEPVVDPAKAIDSELDTLLGYLRTRL